MGDLAGVSVTPSIHPLLFKKTVPVFFSFRISWGLLGFRIGSSPDGWQVDGEIGSATLVSRPVGQISTPSIPETEEWAMPETSDVLRLAKTGAWFLPYVLRHLSLDAISGDLTIGLGDPAWTGSVYGYYHAIRPLVSSERCSVDITPDFTRMTLEGSLQGGIMITTPLDLVIRGVRTFLPGIIRIWRKSSV